MPKRSDFLTNPLKYPTHHIGNFSRCAIPEQTMYTVYHFRRLYELCKYVSQRVILTTIINSAEHTPKYVRLLRY